MRLRLSLKAKVESTSQPPHKPMLALAVAASRARARAPVPLRCASTTSNAVPRSALGERVRVLVVFASASVCDRCCWIARVCDVALAL